MATIRSARPPGGMTCDICQDRLHNRCRLGRCPNCMRKHGHPQGRAPAPTGTQRHGIPITQAMAALHEQNVARYAAIVAAGGRLFEEAD